MNASPLFVPNRVALAVALALSGPSALAAVDCTVSVPTDDGTGNTANTLSWAIMTANNGTTPSTPYLSGHPGGGCTNNTITLATDVTLTGVMKRLIDSNLTLQSDATRRTLGGGNLYRPLFVKSGTVVIRNLNLINGKAKGGKGGGGGAGLGGALFVYGGTITVENVGFTNDNATGGQGDGFGDGTPGGGGMFGNGSSGGGGLFGDSPGIDGGYGGTGAYGGSGGSYGVGGVPGAPGSGGGFGGGGGLGFGVPGFDGGFGGGGGYGGFGSSVGSDGGRGGFGGGGGRGGDGRDGGDGGDGGFGGGGGGSGAGLGDANVGVGGGIFGTPGFGGFGGARGYGGGGGGGGAGFGGAIFVKRGMLTLKAVAFETSSAVRAGTLNGQGRGGALFVCTNDLDSDSTPKGAKGGCSASIDETNSCGVTFSGGIAAQGQPDLFWTGASGGAHSTAGITDSCPVPAMSVTGNSLTIANGDTTPSTTDATDWGNITLGNSPSHTFTIRNTGNAALHLTGTPLVALNGADCAPFSVTAQPTTPVATTTGSTPFQVQYAPTSATTSACTVSIANDDATHNPYTFALAGTGVKVTTTTTVTSAPNPSTYGQSVTFTATVNPSAATGTMNFKDNGTSISGCASQTLTSGTATCTTVAALSVGSHPITADYSGDSTYATSSGTLAGGQTVNKASQTIGSITFNPTTLDVNGTTTASASASSGLPVSFSSQTTGACTVSGNTVTGVAAGTCTIAADQAGDANYNAAAQVTNDITATCPTPISVTSTADSGGVCVGAGAPNNCTLRQAIADSCPGSMLVFDLGINGQTITLTSGALNLGKDLTISGNGRQITVSGNDASSVFLIGGGTVNLIGLTITHGSAANGGGLINVGGTVTLSNNTFANNSATATGGAIYNASGNLAVANSTFVNNAAATHGTGLASASGTVTVLNSSFAGSATGGEIAQSGGTVSLINTLIDNATATCSGTITDGGHNLERRADCGFSATSSRSNTNPLLGTLGDYGGGTTQTLPLLPGSPAIDAGDATTCTNNPVGGIDQRYNPRPVGTTCDIGAFESQGFNFTQSGNNQSAVISTAFANPLGVTITPNQTGEPVDGGQVTFTAPGSGPSATLTASLVTISGNTASVTATANSTAGSYNVAASAAGASDATFAITNTKATATVALNNFSQTYDGAPKSAICTTTPSGLTTNITYNSSTTPPTNAGNYTAVCTVSDANYQGSDTRTFTIAKADQTITFTPPASGTVGSSDTLNATASSGLTVSFDSQTGGVCTVSGSTVNYLVTGICTVRSSQVGDANYNAASNVDRNIVVSAVQQQTTTTLTSAANPSTFNQNIPLTATVSGHDPTGTVAFSADSNALADCASVALTGNGDNKTADCATATLTGGAHALSAVYSGDANNQTSTGTLQQVVQNIVTGQGDVTATFNGGGNSCNLTQATFVGTPATPPTGYAFPYGLLRFTLGGMCSNSPVTIQITYPTTLPTGTKYWKYGKTSDNATAHWYALPATLTGNTATFTLTDGGLGDDDLTVNGSIIDDGGVGVPATDISTTDIPTLSEWALLLLAGLLGLFGMRRVRRA